MKAHILLDSFQYVNKRQISKLLRTFSALAGDCGASRGRGSGISCGVSSRGVISRGGVSGGGGSTRCVGTCICGQFKRARTVHVGVGIEPAAAYLPSICTDLVVLTFMIFICKSNASCSCLCRDRGWRGTGVGAGVAVAVDDWDWVRLLSLLLYKS